MAARTMQTTAMTGSVMTTHLGTLHTVILFQILPKHETQELMLNALVTN